MRERSNEEKYDGELSDFRATVWLAQAAFNQRKAPTELPLTSEGWNPGSYWNWQGVVGAVWRIECRQRLLAQV